MKVNEILNLTVEEFEKELSQRNFDYINENYVTIANGLEMYQEGARLSIGEEYLNVNEYFNIIRDMEQNCEEELTL